jgi:hypothetical protein
MGTSGRKSNGHAGLGAELRRLRGGRTLQQVADLSRTPPLADRIKPVAAPTLSLIENGISMPSLDTLYTLSVIYRVPMQRLYELVGLERMVSAVEVPEALGEIKAAYHAALRHRRWPEAVALAVAGERHVGSDLRAAMAWRFARATALPGVGLAVEAILLLHECLEQCTVAGIPRHVVLRNLCSAQHAAGYFDAAAVSAREALQCAPSSLSDAELLALREGLIGALVARRELDGEADERLARQVQRLVREARVAGAPASLVLDLYEAVSHRIAGNRAQGEKALRDLARRAAEGHDSGVELAAWWHLGVLRRLAGDARGALPPLSRAESLARASGDPAVVFDATYQLLLVATLLGEEALARRCRRACERHYVLVQAKTPSLVHYETAGGGGLAR